MYMLSPKLTLLAFVPLPIIPLLVMRNEREIHHRYEGVQEQFSKLSAVVQESLNGIRVTKAFAKENVQNRAYPRGRRGARSSKSFSRARAVILRPDARFHDESGTRFASLHWRRRNGERSRHCASRWALSSRFSATSRKWSGPWPRSGWRSACISAR